MDDIAPPKGPGHAYLIISAPELGLVWEVLKDRKKASVEAWVDERGPEGCAPVEVCCADRWEAYHPAAQAKVPNAPQTVDRFQVMKNLNEAVTQARRTIQKHAEEATPETLKGGRWLLVKNAENLTDEEQVRLQALLARSPDLKTGYDLKEAFRTGFHQSANRPEAAAGLTEWIAKVEASGLKALQAFLKTLANGRERILNYFAGRPTIDFHRS